MTLKNCPCCGGAATIQTETLTPGRLYSVRAVCTICGKRGKRMFDKKEPAAGTASLYWARMNWNCGLFEQEGKA